MQGHVEQAAQEALNEAKWSQKIRDRVDNGAYIAGQRNRIDIDTETMEGKGSIVYIGEKGGRRDTLDPYILKRCLGREYMHHLLDRAHGYRSSKIHSTDEYRIARA